MGFLGQSWTPLWTVCQTKRANPRHKRSSFHGSSRIIRFQRQEKGVSSAPTSSRPDYRCSGPHCRGISTTKIIISNARGIPVGGRLYFFYPQWLASVKDLWVLPTIKWYRIEFVHSTRAVSHHSQLGHTKQTLLENSISEFLLI